MCRGALAAFIGLRLLRRPGPVGTASSFLATRTRMTFWA